jgi:hypothetical protein
VALKIIKNNKPLSPKKEVTHNTEAINTTTKEITIISKATSIKKIITMEADISVSNSSINMYRRNLNLLSNIQVEIKRRIEQVIMLFSECHQYLRR